MITVRKADDRGHANHGWLDSFHTFSFADYYDENFMGFQSLRVINEDTVQGGGGFGTHPHRDMEIITYVISGELEHQDSGGHAQVLRAGEVQRISAGSGIFHSEYNHSGDEPVHFLQIWIIPELTHTPPEYEQKSFADVREGELRLVASHDGRDGSISIKQDADLYLFKYKEGQSVAQQMPNNRAMWVQVAEGALNLNGTQLVAGDGAAITDEALLKLAAVASGQALVFDLLQED